MAIRFPIFPRRRLLAGALIACCVLALPAQAALTLEQAVELARARNERAAIAEEQASAAQARLARARAFFFPELSATGNYVRRGYETVRELGGQTATLQARDALSSTVVARWALLDVRGFPLYRQARHERDAVRLESDESLRLLAFEAADAFLLTLSAEQVHDAARRRLEFARQNLADAKARLAAQLVSSNDVTRAELELATAEREATRAAGTVEAAYVHLGFLINAPVERPLAQPEALFVRAADELPQEPALLTQAAAQRSDVAAANERALAAEALAQEPRYRLFPSLSLTGQYRWTNETGFTGRTGDGFLGLELAWPLFDGGERYAEARERRSLSAIAKSSAQLRLRQVEVEVKNSLVALSSARAALAQATVAAEVARRNAQETGELYRQGLTGALEVSDASVRLFEAEVAQARERYGLAISFLDLRAALGADVLEGR